MYCLVCFTRNSDKENEKQIRTHKGVENMHRTLIFLCSVIQTFRATIAFFQSELETTALPG